jgi:hypothetical protein
MIKNQLVPSRYRPPQQSTVDYYSSVQGPLRAFKDGVLGRSAASLGKLVLNTTPIHLAQKTIRRNSVQGLGQTDAAVMGAVALVVLTYVVVTGALSYQAGKAMAPGSKDRSTWGWVGVPVGVLTGPWGLGVMGIVSNSRKS